MGGVGPPLTEVLGPQRILTHAYSRVVLRVLEAAVAAKKRFSVYITESQPDLSGQVPLRAVLCPAVIVEGRLWAQAIARSQGMPRPAAPHAACLPASSHPGESHGRHSGSRCRPRGGPGSSVRGSAGLSSAA